MKISARKVLARNVRALMKAANINQAYVAEHYDVSQKTVSNVLNEESAIAPTLDTIEALARGFRIDPWQLLLPGLDRHIDRRKDVRKMFTNYLASTDAGKKHIQTVAEREFQYSIVESGRFEQPKVENQNGEAA